MNKAKLTDYIANTGETLVIIGAAMWITQWEVAKFIFAVGTLLFVVGRLAAKNPETHSITLKRLYVQRMIGLALLVVAALLMFFYESLNGLEITDYVVRSTPSAWLLPFMIFVVLELYTAFRIPTEIKKEQA